MVCTNLDAPWKAYNQSLVRGFNNPNQMWNQRPTQHNTKTKRGMYICVMSWQCLFQYHLDFISMNYKNKPTIQCTSEDMDLKEDDHRPEKTSKWFCKHLQWLIFHKPVESDDTKWSKLLLQYPHSRHLHLYFRIQLENESCRRLEFAMGGHFTVKGTIKWQHHNEGQTFQRSSVNAKPLETLAERWKNLGINWKRAKKKQNQNYCAVSLTDYTKTFSAK